MPPKPKDETQPSDIPAETEAAPVAPPALKFVGHSDVFVAGVPQGPLEVVDAPAYQHQVSPTEALALIKTGLYTAADKYEAPAPPAEEVV